MKISGLHQLIFHKRNAAGVLARQSLEEDKSPVVQREKALESETLVREAEELAEHLKGNEETREGIMHLVNYLARSPHTKNSRYRKLAITALEEADGWLHRENGDPEPNRNFEVMETPAPAPAAAAEEAPTKFRCEQCGKEFDPDPAAMVETGWSPFCTDGMSEEEIKAMEETENAITPEELEAMNEYQLREIGMTPEQREKLLKGEIEHSVTGAMCLCTECQDRMFNEQNREG